MSEKKDILETSDDRNNDQLHQQHRHAVRAKRNRNHTLLHNSSDFTKHTRLSARSWKRQDLTTIRDSSDIQRAQEENLFDNDIDHKYNSKTPKEFTVKGSIDNKDADSLAVIINQLKLHNDEKKDRKNMFYRKKTSHPHTMLTHAIVGGDSECIRVILENIFRDYIYPTIIDHVCSNGRTALWYACKKGDLHLVKQLVERGHANINKCGVLMVAAQNGHGKVVDYLLSKGCDPNRRVKNYNERALHAASRRNHLGIVNALLQHGADPFILDYKKRTALDYAIHKRHLDIAKVLIDHQGGHFGMNHTGFTPLMLAASRNNTPMVDILLDILPRQRALEELELLACRYTIHGVVSKRGQAYCYFEQVLSMPTPLSNIPVCEAYEFRSECQTLDELALIRENDDAMRIHALLVSERLLLKNGGVNHLVSLIIKQSDIYRWNGIVHRCLQLRLHAYRLMTETKHNDWHSPTFHKKYFNKLLNILRQILYKEDTVPIESLVLIWSWILERKDNTLNELLFQFLLLITYLIESKKVNGNEQSILFGLIRRALRQNVTMTNGLFLLSFCIDEIADGFNEFTFGSIRIPTLWIVRLLIHCGADVDEVSPRTKSTPLHMIAQCSNVDEARSVIKLLLNANAHIDCINNYDEQPEDCASDLVIKELLRANRRDSLKCRCAHLINLRDVCYVNYLSSNLISFVRMHSSDQIGANARSVSPSNSDSLISHRTTASDW